MNDKQHTLARLLSAVALALVFFFAAGLMPARAQSGSLPEFIPGEVLVEIKPGASIDAVAARYEMRLKQRIYGTNFYRLGTPKNKKEAKFRKRLANDPDVLSATLNPVITTPVNVFGRSVIGFPGDHPTPGQSRAQYLAQQFAGDLVALQARSTGTGIIVAVIDTGLDRNHPDISNHLWTDPGETPDDNIDNDNDGLTDDVYGWDFYNNNKDTMEHPASTQTTIAGHGTFIAGLITLLAPDVKIMPVRAFSPEGVSDAFTIAEAIKYAVDHGAKIINLSFGTSEASQVMRDAVTYAKGRGVLMIAAVGNEDKGNDAAPQFPANWSADVMGVAALDANDRKAGFSNFGSNVSVSALGINLVSAYPLAGSAPDYATWSGTSFAAPLATAEAALLLEKAPLQQSVRDLIESSAVNIDARNPGFINKLGKGRIDPLAALVSINPVVSNRGEISLSPSGVEPTASGKAEVEVAGSEQSFEIEGEGLTPRAGYKLVVDGNVIIDGTSGSDPNARLAQASNFGTFKIEFYTPQRSEHPLLPAALTPVTNIKLVEVRDALDRIVLSNSFGTPQTGGSGGGSVEKEARLTSPNGSARGSARAEIEAERQKLRVEGDGLQSGVAYQIVADGISLGSFTAQSSYLRVEFTSDGSSGHVLPSSLQPVTRIARIVVFDTAGQTVLEGTFQSGGDDFGGGGGDDGGGGSGGGGGDSGGGSGGGSTEVSKETSLNSTGVDSDAKGKVKTRFSATRESIEVEGDKLDDNASYVIVIDGSALTTVSTEGNGSFKVELSTDSGTLPSFVRPVSNIQRIEVWDRQNRIVLAGGPPR
ncbi:MAG: S8 family serine peptidase [Blastocatellia bacterium]